MTAPGTDETKKHHVSMRVDEATVEYLDGLADDWDIDNRSEVLRIIIKSHHGLLFGNFFGITNNDQLTTEWGDLGHILASMTESERGVPPSLDDARLADVIEPLPILMRAAEVEAHNVDGNGLNRKGASSDPSDAGE